MTSTTNKLLTIISVSLGIALASTVNANPFARFSDADGCPLASHGGGGGKAISLFRRIDTNHDGLLSLEEVTTARLKRASYRFRRIDSDDDGFLSLEEYLAATANRQDRLDEYGEALFVCVEEKLDIDLPDPDSLPTPEERFTVIDADGDGFVSKSELDEFLTIRVAEKFTAADLNGDSTISWDEFRPVVQDRLNRRRAFRQCIDELTDEDETLEDLIEGASGKSVSPF